MKSIIAVLIAFMALCATTTFADDSGKEEALSLAKQRMDQSKELQTKREYRASIPPAQRALEIREKLLGPNHLDTAEALDVLGRGYRLATDYGRAEPLILRALHIRERTLGSKHLTTAISLNNLGGLYFSMNKYREAEPYFVRALSVRQHKLGDDHMDSLVVMNNLALLYSKGVRYDVAKELATRALTGFERVCGADSLMVADALTIIAYLDFLSGRDSEAEAQFIKALAIKERILGLENFDIAITLTNLAQQYLVTGALQAAEKTYLRAIDIVEKTEGPENVSLFRFLNGLALVYVQTREYDRAELLYQRALLILQKTLGEDNLGNAAILNDLGELKIAVQSFEQAESFLKRALVLKQALDPRHPSIGYTLHALATATAHLGRTKEAEALFLRALELREHVPGPTNRLTGETLVTLGSLYWAKGEYGKAFSSLSRAENAQSQYGGHFLTFGSESRKRAYLQMLAADTEKYISFSTTATDRNAVALGLDSVLQHKGRALDAMTDSATRLRRSIKPEDRELFERLSTIANEFSTITYSGPGDISSKGYNGRLEKLRAQQEQLESELSNRSNEFRRQVAPITLSDVRRAIPANAALIEWFRYTPFDPKTLISKSPPTANAQPRYVAYVVKQQSDPVVVDVGDAESIDSFIGEFRADAGQPRNGNIRAISNALYEKLWAPLSNHLRGVEHVLVSPDGALNLLPMSALLDNQDKYLAERFEITMLTSGRDLVKFDSKAHAQSGAVVVADANFGTPANTTAQLTPISGQRSIEFDPALDRGGLIFRPLPNSALEAQELKLLLGANEASLLLRDDASESNLKKLHGPLILHIASHGFFLSDQEMMTETKGRVSPEQSSTFVSDNPLIRSGIALAGANTRRSGDNDDGILTALEVAQLDLHGTELVVLSACDSGIGDVHNGEGVYGLRRALVLAGAQTQVTSLWKVSDEATRKLMVNYYERLLKGEGRSAALRHAQLDMLHEPEFSHPYYWASFVSSGNWAPISGLSANDRVSRAH